jgi:rhodanese-related sulfurtransferase
MALAAVSRSLQSAAPAAARAYTPEHPLLQQAREQVHTLDLPYSGDITPAAACELIEQQAAVLVDVRTAEERKFVGYVPGSLHLPWLIGTAMQTNPRFLRELEAKVPKNAVVLLLCRSGARSVAAATAARRAGFQHVYNVLEGFEGELDQNGHRGSRNGWRFRGLPWVQD